MELTLILLKEQAEWQSQYGSARHVSTEFRQLNPTKVVLVAAFSFTTSRVNFVLANCLRRSARLPLFCFPLAPPPFSSPTTFIPSINASCCESASCKPMTYVSYSLTKRSRNPVRCTET